MTTINPEPRRALPPKRGRLPLMVLVILALVAAAAAGFIGGRETAPDEDVPEAVRTEDPLPEICQRTVTVADRIGTDSIAGLEAARAALDAADPAESAPDVDQRLAQVRALTTQLDALLEECGTAFAEGATP